MQKGQALLLVLLSMAVVLTVVLSIISRSIVDINITNKEEESLRAFSAAEAGIEKALITGTSIGTTSIGDASFAANVYSSSVTTTEFANPSPLSSGESGIVWFVNHDQNGNPVCTPSSPCFTGSKIDLCWGEPGTVSSDPETPAVEVNIFYDTTPNPSGSGDYADVKVARAAFDPNTGRSPGSQFDTSVSLSCAIGQTTYAFKKTIDLSLLSSPISSSVYSNQNGLLFARVRMFYNTSISHEFGVSVNFPGQGQLPPQGIKIESTGTSGTANRKVEVFQGFGETPPIFDSAVYSEGAIIK